MTEQYKAIESTFVHIHVKELIDIIQGIQYDGSLFGDDVELVTISHAIGATLTIDMKRLGMMIIQSGKIIITTIKNGAILDAIATLYQHLCETEGSFAIKFSSDTKFVPEKLYPVYNLSRMTISND